MAPGRAGRCGAAGQEAEAAAENRLAAFRSNVPGGALSETQPVMKTSRVHSPAIWGESYSMSLQHDYAPRPRGSVPPGAPNKAEIARHRSRIRGGGTFVFRRALT